MKTGHILMLCILGAALLSTVVFQNSGAPEKCCFQFYPRRIRKTLVERYDFIDERCPKTGVILVAKDSRRVCVDPSLSWVQDIMTAVDEKTSHSTALSVECDLTQQADSKNQSQQDFQCNRTSIQQKHLNSSQLLGIEYGPPVPGTEPWRISDRNSSSNSGYNEGHSHGNSRGSANCCFRFYLRRIRKTLVERYEFTDERCPKTGVMSLLGSGHHDSCG